MSTIRFISRVAATVGVLALGTASAHALDGGDAAKGENVFKRCMSCHMVGEGAKNKVGPVLNNVIGRTAGTYEDYRYGPDIVKAGEQGLVWNEDEIFAYLEDPRAFLREKLDDKSAKSKMAFKLRGEDDRKDVIAYVKTFSPDAPTEGEATEEKPETTN